VAKVTSAAPAPERYSTPAPAARSDLFGAVVYGLAGAVLVAIVWLVAAGTLALTWALVGVAAFGGWVVGSAVGWGAWNRTGPRRTHPVARLIAIALALLAWLGGTYLAYLWKLVVSARADEPVAQRLAEQDFARWLPSEFGPLQIAQLAVIALLAWWSSR
jgi:hypothetical protein